MGANVPNTTELLARWRTGDDAALHELLDQHLPWIREYVRQRLGPVLRAREEPNDVVQDALVEFLRYGPRFELQNEAHLRFLLARIAENVLRDKHDFHSRQRRQASREVAGAPEDHENALGAALRPSEEPHVVVERRQWRAWVRLSLDLLDPADREVLVLRQWDGLEFAQIGERLSLSADAAKMRFHRAVPKLAERIEQLQRGDFSGLVLEDSAAAATRIGRD